LQKSGSPSSGLKKRDHDADRVESPLGPPERVNGGLAEIKITLRKHRELVRGERRTVRRSVAVLIT